MKMQNISIVLSAILLFIGIILNDMVIAVVAFVGIAISGWGFVYPDKANVWFYKVQSNFAKDKLEKELNAYQQELKLAEGYILRFATAFNVKFPLRWNVDYKGDIIPATINELPANQLQEPFRHFQELLRDEGITVPDYLIQLSINQKIDQIRYLEFEEFFNRMLEDERNPKNVIKLYAQQIGITAAEMQYFNKLFTIEYLQQYLSKQFSKADIKLQLGFDLAEIEKTKKSIQKTLQEFTSNIERERRVNTMRGILNGKIMPTTHKDCNEWLKQGSKVMEDDLKELFNRMGYEVKEPSTKIQGTDLIVKKINKKIAIKYNLVLEGSVGTKTIQEAYAGKHYWDCETCIVITNSSYSKDSLELANKLKVELWDGKTVQELLDKYWNQDVEYWNLLKDNRRKLKEDEKETSDQILQSFSHVN